MAKDTYIPRDEVVAMNKECDKVRKKAEKELMALPGVLAVGVGLKERKGEIQRELCFKITVEKKRDKSGIKVKDLVPEKIYGFKTDVVEKIITLPASNSRKYRPLIGGSQIQSSTSSLTGTLGCFAKRNSDDKIVLLTNWHVVIKTSDHDTDEESIGQPYHNGCCDCCATGEFATVVDGRFNSTHDVAIALLNGQEADTIPSEKYINEILGIGLITGSAEPLGTETVYKYGRKTGLTKGQILNDNTLLDVDYSGIYDGLGIVSRPGIRIIPSDFDIPPEFIDFGDCGSVTVNEHNQVIVLNWALAGGGRISQIEADLDITILDSTFPASTPNKTGVPLSSVSTADAHVSLADALSELETEIGHFSEGRRMLELFKEHRVELLDLVRNRREVMVAWHRYQGPAYLANIARSVRRENKPIPEQINGISLQSLVLKMTAVLQRNGTPELAQSVQDNYLQLMNMLSAGHSPQEWKAHLAKMDRTN